MFGEDGGCDAIYDAQMTDRVCGSDIVENCRGLCAIYYVPAVCVILLLILWGMGPLLMLRRSFLRSFDI